MREGKQPQKQASKPVSSGVKDQNIVHKATTLKQTTGQKGIQKKNTNMSIKSNTQVYKQTTQKQDQELDLNNSNIDQQHQTNQVQTKQQNIQQQRDEMFSQISQDLVIEDVDQLQQQKDNQFASNDRQQIQQQEQLQQDDVEINNSDAKDQSMIDELKQLEAVETKYGNQHIDLSEIQQQQQQLQLNTSQDPSRPQNLAIPNKHDPNEPLPSYSNRVNIGEFSVGNFKEFQLREDLAHLIEKYNKQFYGEAKKPIIRGNDTQIPDKEQKYKDKMITNPIAVPNPSSSSEGNYSWMYLMTPYYNQLVKEFNGQQLENHILQQHFEYYVEMEKEKDLLNEEFDLLKKAEQQLQAKLENEQVENKNAEQKVEYLEHNLQSVIPDRFKEMNEKIENLNNILRAKDNVIEQMLNEITLIKNEKDDVQNEVLFKKQKIENLNIEFNTKELEYQRVWQEEQDLKAEVRGETSQCQDIKRESEMLLREIAMTRDEINQNRAALDELQSNITEKRTRVQDYESRLRYANDVIMSLESENQQVELDIAQAKATVEGQSKAYNELRKNFYMANNFGQDGSMQMSSSSPVIQIPKIVMPSSYYRPSAAISKATINLLPSTSKALSQQVMPNNIKNYLSVKKATIDLTSDLSKSGVASKDQKVRFSMASPMPADSGVSGGYSNLATRGEQRRSDSLDLRLERRNFKNLLSENDLEGPQSPRLQNKQNTMSQNFNQNARQGSVNRNFIDSMGGLLGMSQDNQQLINLRASAQNNTFPLKRVEVPSNQASPQKSNMKDTSSYFESPNVKRIDTDTSDLYGGYGGSGGIRESYNRATMDTMDSLRQSTLSVQTPYRNRAGQRGGPGNRSSQPQQLNSVKQKTQQQYSVRGYNQANEENLFREATWQERMSHLPKNSAYKSSIMFGEDGITTREAEKTPQYQQQQQNDYFEPKQRQPFQMARDYDVDVDLNNESDPQAKAQIIKFKQQKIFELTDQRKLKDQEMVSLPSQLKAKLSSVTSPKLKLSNLGMGSGNGQSPQMSNLQKGSQVNNGLRDFNNQSQSPVDSTNRGSGVIQKIQMKNLPFIPAKAQSPVNVNHNPNQTTNILNQNNNGQSSPTDHGQTTQTKISPQRIMGGTNKVIIPANQIKLIKKDGTAASPSPEARLTNGTKQQISPTNMSMIGQSNIQNTNPNISCNLIRNSMKNSKPSNHHHHANQNKHQKPQQQSDDETNVNSDNEERSSNLSQFKPDQSANNFNRPKLNTNPSQQTLFTDQTLASQRTQRGNQESSRGGSSANGVKVISQKQIRHSPSPPPNQALKSDKPPIVTNVQSQLKSSNQHQQNQTNPKQQQPQLASDYIKGMITQSRTNNQANNGTSTTGGTLQKKILGSGISGIKKNQASQQANFQKDMKKHGIAKDIQEVNQFNQILSENSPPRQDENNGAIQNNVFNKPQNSKLLVTKVSHIRNYSPPPNFDQNAPANVHSIHQNNNQQKPPQNQTSQQTDSSPTNSTIPTTDDQQQQQQASQPGEGNVFQFPFQRRARSLSLPKQEIIQSKLGNKNQQPNQPAGGQNSNNGDEKSQSPHRGQPENQLQEAKRTGPVVAKVNFVIGQQGVMKQQEDDSNVFERNKEVDEWLMGSGESDNTAGSNTSNKQNGIIGGISISVKSTTQKKQQTELEKPIQPNQQNEGDDNSVDGGEEEDWMFKTFDKGKSKKDGKPAANTARVNNNRQMPSQRDFNLEDDLGESPFDMAPEMNQQFNKPKVKENCFMLDEIGEDCQDLSQYMDKIDEFMLKMK